MIYVYYCYFAKCSPPPTCIKVQPKLLFYALNLKSGNNGIMYTRSFYFLWLRVRKHSSCCVIFINPQTIENSKGCFKSQLSSVNCLSSREKSACLTTVEHRFHSPALACLFLLRCLFAKKIKYLFAKILLSIILQFF